MISTETSSPVGPTVRVTHLCQIGFSRAIPAVGHPDETRAFVLNQALRKANRGAVLDDICASLAEAGGDEAVRWARHGPDARAAEMTAHTPWNATW